MNDRPMDFDTGAWLKDPQLSMCEPATRGIWIDALASMHEKRRSGTLSGTLCQLARTLRCTEAALVSAIDDLQATGTADVTQRNGIVTLVNRRMVREYKIREQGRLRQERFRDSGKCNASNKEDVTEESRFQGMYSSNLSFQSKKEEKKASKEELCKRLFVSFYEAYPRKENPKGARKAFDRAGITEELLSHILAWLERAKLSEQWQDKSKIPHPATWLNQRRWEGDPPPLPDPHSTSKFEDVEEYNRRQGEIALRLMREQKK